MAIQIDLRVPPCEPVPKVAAFVRECEAAGFDGVGLLDSQMLERDVFVSMAAALQSTDHIRVASAVTNPITRHPSVIASAAQTVSEIAPGRAQIWIGRGYSSTATVGLKPATVRQMRNAIVTVKELMAGDTVQFETPTADAPRERKHTHPHLHRGHRPAGHARGWRGLRRRGPHDGHPSQRRGGGTGAHCRRGALRRPEPGRYRDRLHRHNDNQGRPEGSSETARPLAVQRLMEGTHKRWLQARRSRPRRTGIARWVVGPLPRRSSCRGLAEGPGVMRLSARRCSGPVVRHHRSHRYSGIRRGPHPAGGEIGPHPPVLDDRGHLRIRHR